MIQGVFPRLFGNYREGAILSAKFTVGGGGAAAITFTLKTLTTGGRKVASFPGVSIARTGVGIATVSLRGTGSSQTSSLGVLDLSVAQLIHVPASATAIASYFHLLPSNFNDAAGTFDFKPTTQAGGAFAEFAMANGDEIHTILYVNK
jgi:hypothetical protein